MKICIVGAGSIGGYVGVKLAQAGEDVTIIARNANLKRFVAVACVSRCLMASSMLSVK